MTTSNLEVLSDAASLERTLKEFQQLVEELRHFVAALKEDHVDPTPPVGSLDVDDDTSQQRLFPTVGTDPA